MRPSEINTEVAIARNGTASNLRADEIKENKNTISSKFAIADEQW